MIEHVYVGLISSLLIHLQLNCVFDHQEEQETRQASTRTKYVPWYDEGGEVSGP